MFAHMNSVHTHTRNRREKKKPPTRNNAPRYIHKDTHTHTHTQWFILSSPNPPSPPLSSRYSHFPFIIKQLSSSSGVSERTKKTTVAVTVKKLGDTTRIESQEEEEDDDDEEEVDVRIQSPHTYM